MTKKQRADHIENINNLLIEIFGNPDRWGHYKSNGCRVKMQKTSLRLEKNINKRWVKCSSSYFKNVDLIEFRKQLMFMKVV